MFLGKRIRDLARQGLEIDEIMDKLKAEGWEKKKMAEEMFDKYCSFMEEGKVRYQNTDPQDQRYGDSFTMELDEFIKSSISNIREKVREEEWDKITIEKGSILKVTLIENGDDKLVAIESLCNTIMEHKNDIMITLKCYYDNHKLLKDTPILRTLIDKIEKHDLRGIEYIWFSCQE